MLLHLPTSEMFSQVTNEEINSIKPVSPFKRPKYRSAFGTSGGRGGGDGGGNLVPGVRLNFEGSGRGADVLRDSAKRLDQYTLSRERELILTHSKSRSNSQKCLGRIFCPVLDKTYSGDIH